MIGMSPLHRVRLPSGEEYGHGDDGLADCRVCSGVAAAAGHGGGHLRFWKRVQHQAESDECSARSGAHGRQSVYRGLNATVTDLHSRNSRHGLERVASQQAQRLRPRNHGGGGGRRGHPLEVDIHHSVRNGWEPGADRWTADSSFTSTLTAGGNPIKMITTNVSLLYPYQWQFNRIITVMLPTAIYPGTTQISVSSVVANQN